MIDMWPRYVARGVGAFTSLRDAARAVAAKQGYVTARTGYVQWFYETEWKAPQIIRPTVLEEVVSAPMEPGDDDAARRPGRDTIPLAEFARRGLDALDGTLKEIARAVDVLRNVVLCMPLSGGWDSRLLARMLADHLVGREITTLSWPPEAAEGASLAHSLGWWVHQIHATQIDMLLDPVAKLGRLDDPSRWMGGYHHLLDYLDHEDATVISAVFSDEICHWAQRDVELHEFIRGRYLDQHQPAPWLTPYLSTPWLNLLCRYDLRAIEPEPGYSISDTLKREMLRQLGPHLLDAPNPRFELAAKLKVGPLPHQVLPFWARDAMRESMAEMRQAIERYPTERKPDLPSDRISVYDPWLCEYSRLAILCGLQEAGIEVQA